MKNSILEMNGIHKRFPGVYALKNVSFSLKPGEVHSLVGENGAGKSTLMNVLMGIVHPDEGEIVLNDNKTTIDSPAYAIRNGIGMVPQELNVIPEITILAVECLGDGAGLRQQRPGTVGRKVSAVRRIDADQ